ncbi:hypothetical protein [Winogradskya consettensis]|uniref:hypothetical protein n=1 Tax=Winogradskya consettensis TaxID=113560 RepID=UPI001BB32354|nr:hypothetical protein [Actinoplanes consettensis]
MTAGPIKPAAYFTTVMHGMSQRPRDGATAAELTDTAEPAVPPGRRPDRAGRRAVRSSPDAAR